MQVINPNATIKFAHATRKLSTRYGAPVKGGSETIIQSLKARLIMRELFYTLSRDGCEPISPKDFQCVQNVLRGRTRLQRRVLFKIVIQIASDLITILA